MISLLFLLFTLRTYATGPELRQELRPELVRDVSLGLLHTCVLTATEANCFGNSKYGQGESVGGFKNARKIVSGQQFNCVLDDEGVWCWGLHMENQPRLLHPRDVVAGREHACALDDEGVKCWGRDSEISFEVQTFLSSGDVLEIAAGANHTCARTSKKLLCWGKNEDGVLDEPLKDFTGGQMRLGQSFTCILSSSIQGLLNKRKLTCWGLRKTSDVIDADDVLTFSRVSTICYVLASKMRCEQLEKEFGPEKNLKFWSLAEQHGCGVDEGVGEGEEWFKCIGADNYFNIQLPRKLANPHSIWLENDLSCGADSEGIRCRGSGSRAHLFRSYQRGDIYRINGRRSCRIRRGALECEGLIIEDSLIGKSVTDMSMGTEFECYLISGKVSCFGLNTVGQINVPEMDEVIQLKSAKFFSCALLKDRGKLSCWGFNSYAKTFPPEDQRDIVNFDIGDAATCLIFVDHRLKCFGADEMERELKNVSRVAVGRRHVCAVVGSEVKCWGENTEAQTSVPQIKGKILDLQAGWDHTCVLTDLGIQCWGAGTYGQIYL